MVLCMHANSGDDDDDDDDIKVFKSELKFHIDSNKG